MSYGKNPQTIHIDNPNLDALNSSLAQKVNLADISEGSRKIKVVACVIRNDGTGWAFIENSQHSKLNVSSITADTTGITINFGFTASKILSFVATPDDTYARQGLIVGASVGVSSAVLNLAGAIVGGYVYYNGTSWVAPSGVTASFSAGILTLTHMNVGAGNIASVSGRDGINASLGSNGATTTQIKFYDSTGTLKTTADTTMKCFFSRGGYNSNASLDPASFTNSNGNIWCMGVFEVS